MAQVTLTIQDVPSGIADKKIKLLTFAGQLDESNVDEKAKEVYALIGETESSLSLIFDFSQLEYMNSKSIGYLTDWYTKLNEKSGSLVIANARPNIIDILQVVGLTQLINCVGTVDEAKVVLMK